MDTPGDEKKRRRRRRKKKGAEKGAESAEEELGATEEVDRVTNDRSKMENLQHHVAARTGFPLSAVKEACEELWQRALPYDDAAAVEAHLLKRGCGESVSGGYSTGTGNGNGAGAGADAGGHEEEYERGRKEEDAVIEQGGEDADLEEEEEEHEGEEEEEHGEEDGESGHRRKDQEGANHNSMARKLEQVSLHADVSGAIAALSRWLATVDESQARILFECHALKNLYVGVLRSHRSHRDKIQADLNDFFLLALRHRGLDSPEAAASALASTAMQVAGLGEGGRGKGAPLNEAGASGVAGRLATITKSLCSGGQPDRDPDVLGQLDELSAKRRAGPNQIQDTGDTMQLFKQREARREAVLLHQRLCGAAPSRGEPASVSLGVDDESLMQLMAVPQAAAPRRSTSMAAAAESDSRSAAARAELEECSRHEQHLRARRAELMAQLDQVEEDIKVSEERRKFLEMSVEQLQQASTAGAASASSDSSAARSAESKARDERVIELLNQLETKVGPASLRVAKASMGTEYLACLEDYIEAEVLCARALRDRLPRHRNDLQSLMRESSEYRALGIKEYVTKLDGRVAELKAIIEDDEHALVVIEEEARCAYQFFKSRWSAHADSRRLQELELRGASLHLGR